MGLKRDPDTAFPPAHLNISSEKPREILLRQDFRSLPLQVNTPLPHQKRMRKHRQYLLYPVRHIKEGRRILLFSDLFYRRQQMLSGKHIESAARFVKDEHGREN